MTINNWVDEKTNALIPELLTPDATTSDTRFVLTNTVYFNASWQETFKPEQTSEGAFHKLDGSTVQKPFMHDTRALSFGEGANYEVVALPYTSSELRMVAILPAAGKLAEVESQLNDAWFASLARRP